MVNAHSLRPLLCGVLLASCQTTKPYAPPAQPAVVDKVEVEVRTFQGRPEAFALVEGSLSTSAAQLVDSRQSRDGNRLYLEVLEQTPRGAALTGAITDSPSFKTKVPLELLGLMPGDYVLSTNGIETPITVPAIRAEALSGETLASTPVPTEQPVDEFIAIEDSSFIEPRYSSEIADPE